MTFTVRQSVFLFLFVIRLCQKIYRQLQDSRLGKTKLTVWDIYWTQNFKKKSFKNVSLMVTSSGLKIWFGNKTMNLSLWIFMAKLDTFDSIDDLVQYDEKDSCLF